MRLSFDADHLRALLALSRQAHRRSPILEQILAPAFWRKDLPAQRRALLDREIRRHGLAFSASEEDVDPELIGPGLVLVGDRGVYLMANLPNDEVKAAGVPHVAYADEVNPERLPVDDWWGAKRASFGPDDGTVFLSERMLAALDRVPAGEKLMIDLSPGKIAILAPASDGPEIQDKNEHVAERSRGFCCQAPRGPA